ncbi:hypothetical protein L798_00545 [Zootermopsis nevadensis]|uniref:Uncharacterized protein n=1 Tax=Zootermopsis nevadensis TaxID=136037 RepID=A0A067QTI0_ZOONE|nr:hypothetical protein L798_00545 [Zootermopsis nevadensis]
MFMICIRNVTRSCLATFWESIREDPSEVVGKISSHGTDSGDLKGRRSVKTWLEYQDSFTSTFIKTTLEMEHSSFLLAVEPLRVECGYCLHHSSFAAFQGSLLDNTVLHQEGQPLTCVARPPRRGRTRMDLGGQRILPLVVLHTDSNFRCPQNEGANTRPTSVY